MVGTGPLHFPNISSGRAQEAGTREKRDKMGRRCKNARPRTSNLALIFIVFPPVSSSSLISSFSPVPYENMYTWSTKIRGKNYT